MLKRKPRIPQRPPFFFSANKGALLEELLPLPNNLVAVFDSGRSRCLAQCTRLAKKPKPGLSSPLPSAGPPAQKRVRSSTDVEERSEVPRHSSELELEDLEPEASSLPCDGPQELKFHSLTSGFLL